MLYIFFIYLLNFFLTLFSKDVINLSKSYGKDFYVTKILHSIHQTFTIMVSTKNMKQQL